MITICEFIAKQLNVPAASIHEKTSMRDVAQWDSLKHMELIVGLEKHYHIELSGDEIADMTSVDAIIKTLAKHGICT